MGKPPQPLTPRARSQRAARRGRPRKFDRPATSVTLTLPEEVIEILQSIDKDLSRAIVRVVQPLDAPKRVASGQLTTFGDRSAVILVPHRRSFTEHTGLELVPLADGRAMICFDGELSVADLELRLSDVLADPDVAPSDREMFQELIAILGRARRAEGVVLKKRRLILLRPKDPSNGNRPS